MLNRQAPEIKQSAAHKVVSSGEGLVGRAREIANRLDERLASFARPQPPQTAVGVEVSEDDIPPFFDEIRRQHNQVHYAFDQIEDLLRRLEV